MNAQWLGRLSYRWAYRLQCARRDAVLEGRASEVLWLLEHDPVYTTGRRPVAELPEGVEVVATERGGLATWHGPGQIVGYAIVDLRARSLGVRAFVTALEEGVITWLADHEVEAGRRRGFPGVWVGRDKVCALGVHIRRGVSLHGFALNLTASLGPFSRITPCGITDGGVTSVLELRGRSPEPAEAAPSLGRAVVRALDAASPGR